MSLDAYVAVVAALGTAGLILVVAGLRGTTAPPGPPSAVVERLRRLWSGTGHTPAERRRHQALLVGALVAAVVGYAVTSVPAVALLAALAVPGLPWLWNVGRREQQAILRVEALGHWTRRLKDQLSTGTGLVSAIVATAVTAPAPIAEPVRTLAARLQTGAPPQRALRRFAAELDDPVAEQVVAVLLLHLHDRGERLGEVLSAIATDTAKQVSMRRDVHAKRTQPRNTVRFMTVFSVLVVAIVARGELMSAYTTPRGQLVLMLLIGAFVAVLVWVRAMSQPPPRRRFLTSSQDLWGGV